jgi:hypothetical protein
MGTQHLTFLPSFDPALDSFTPIEILASYSPPPLKKGCTLKPAQGIIVGGTLLARETATQQMVPYNDAAVGTGAQICVGILADTRDTGAAGSTKPVGGNIYFRGSFKRSALTGLDAAALVDLNAREDTNRDLVLVA